MKLWKPTLVALAVAASLPLGSQAFAAAKKKPAAKPVAATHSVQEALVKELAELKARIAELEGKTAKVAAEAKQASETAKAATASVPAGMTAEQSQEFNRIALKAEAMEDAVEELGLKNLKITGFMDPTYIYNKNQNTAGFQFLHSEDDGSYNYDNGYFGMAVLEFQKETDNGTRFKLSIAPNRGAGSVLGSHMLHEANVNIPLTDLQTRLWAGQIPDWTGYEYSQSNLNKLITHNLLFDFTAPTAYTGAVLDLTDGKWWTRVGLANVNATKYASPNKSPALVYRVDYAKGEFGGFGFTGLHGKLYNYAADDLIDTDFDGVPDSAAFAEAGQHSTTHLLEADAYFIRGDLTLQGQVSWGRQVNAAIYREDGVLKDAKWWGLSGLAAYKLTPRLEAIARADYIDNSKNGGGLLGYNWDDSRNGIGRGMVYDDAGAYWDYDYNNLDKGSKRYALSLGLNYMFNANTQWKVEYRLDGSNGNVFLDVSRDAADPKAYTKRNHLLGTSMVVSF